MNCDWYFTNEDCKKCHYSCVVDLSSEYESHVWECQLGHRIDGQMDVNKKQCGLVAGEYYSAHVTIKKTKE